MKTRSVVHSLAFVLCLLAPASVLAHPGEASIRELARGVENEAIRNELHNHYGDRFKHELARRQQTPNNSTSVTTTSASEPPSSSIVTPTSSMEPSPSHSPSVSASPSKAEPPSSSSTVAYPSSSTGTPSSADNSSTPASTPSSEEPTTHTPKPTPTPTYNTNPITSKKTKTVIGEGGAPSTEYSTEIITPTVTNGASATANPSAASTSGRYEMAGTGKVEAAMMNMFIGVFAVAAGAFLL